MDNEELLMEEHIKPKKWTKAWWNERFIVKLWHNHPEGCMNFLGGALTLAAAIVSAKVNKKAYDEKIYVNVDGDICQIPAKKMRTIKKLNTVN